MIKRTFPRDTVEYVEAVIETVDDPAAATVKLALRDAAASGYTWLNATWVGAATLNGLTGLYERTARTSAVVGLTAASYPARSYTVYAQVTLGSEVAIAECYALTISP